MTCGTRNVLPAEEKHLLFNLSEDLCAKVFVPSLHFHLVPESTVPQPAGQCSVCSVEATVVEGPGDGGFVVSSGEAQSAGTLVLVLQPPAEE